MVNLIGIDAISKLGWLDRINNKAKSGQNPSRRVRQHSFVEDDHGILSTTIVLVYLQTLSFLSFSLFLFKGIQSSTAYMHNDLISYVP